MRPVNQAAIDLIKSFESCRLTAYQDGGGVWTIGWGTTKGVRQGMTMTQEEADQRFEDELKLYAGDVEKNIKVTLTDNQFGALVSFHYNTGAIGRPESKMTLKRLLNAGDYDGASKQFVKWNKDNGKEVRGLTRRREAEKALFLS